MDLTLNGRLLNVTFILPAYRWSSIFWSSAATCWFTKSNAHSKQAEHRKATQTSQRLNRQQAQKVKESLHEDTTTCDICVFPIISLADLFCHRSDIKVAQFAMSSTIQGGSNSTSLAVFALTFNCPQGRICCWTQCLSPWPLGQQYYKLWPERW